MLVQFKLPGNTSAPGKELGQHRALTCKQHRKDYPPAESCLHHLEVKGGKEHRPGLAAHCTHAPTYPGLLLPATAPLTWGSAPPMTSQLHPPAPPGLHSKDTISAGPPYLELQGPPPPFPPPQSTLLFLLPASCFYTALVTVTFVCFASLLALVCVLLVECQLRNSWDFRRFICCHIPVT